MKSKYLLLAIPMLVIVYLIYNNIFASNTFTYFYDIGENDNYLSPNNRISEPAQEEVSYRNLTRSLVYFNAKIPPGAEKITIIARFKDTLPNTPLIIGAQDQPVWHYNWNTIYSPIPDLREFKEANGVYAINPSFQPISLSSLAEADNVVIGGDLPQREKVQPDYMEKETIINNTLRGTHTFYLYGKDLNITIEKQDLNWYNNSDEAIISLYKGNNLVATTTILDDGITEATKKMSDIMAGNISANLSLGLYKMVIEDFDGLIRKIRVNTNKIIINERAYLADSQIFLLNEKPSYLYTNLIRPAHISFQTWHNAGIQNFSIDSLNLSISYTGNETIVILKQGAHNLKIPKNDLIINLPGYIAFSKENYFEPFNNRKASIKNNLTWIKENLDYLVIQTFKKEGNWIIAETTFNLKEDNLYTKDEKLSLVFSIPHLNQENSVPLPLDWIKINVYKRGLLEKI